MSNKLLFNMSGHPLHEDVINVLGEYKIIDIEIPNVDVSSVASIVQYVKDKLVKPVLKKHSKAILTGNYELIPPGLSALSTTTLAFLHGISGHFPTIRWLIRGDSGFNKVSEPLNLQLIRDEVRDSREFKS